MFPGGPCKSHSPPRRYSLSIPNRAYKASFLRPPYARSHLPSEGRSVKEDTMGGRHRPNAVGLAAVTVELPAVPADTVQSSRHRPEAHGQKAGRGSWRAHRLLDSRVGRRRASSPRTHRPTPIFQTAALTGVGVFLIGTVAVGTSGMVQLDTRPSERPDGTWLTVRPGSASGASGGEWVTSPPRATGGTPVSPSPVGTTGATDARTGSNTPTGPLSVSTPAPAADPSPGTAGAGSSPTPAASAAETTPAPAPAPTVKKRCRRRG